MNISVVVLVAVFVLIAVRKIGHFNIKIWQSMTGGALIVVATQQIRRLSENMILERVAPDGFQKNFKLS